MTDVATRLAKVLERIRTAEAEYGREPASVRLLAVSKMQPPEALREALAAGQHAFGESYVQEAETKLAALTDADVEWHFIGPIQSNKTRFIAEHFAWVHSVDRLKIAQRISGQRPAEAAPVDVCIQVNISGEDSKSGVTPRDIGPLASQIAELPGLHLRGLMTIPAPSDDFDEQRRPYRQLREALEALQAQGLAVDSLSMGMTDDLEAAIAEGATMVRIGTALFGPRPDSA